MRSSSSASDFIGRGSRDDGFQRRHFGRVDVGLEPVAVRRRRRRVGADREGLLQVGRRLGALGVAVGLDARGQPAPPGHCHAILPLGCRRQCEELARRELDRCTAMRDTVAGHEQEADVLSAASTSAATAAGSDALNHGARSMTGTELRIRTAHALFVRAVDPDVLVPQCRAAAMKSVIISTHPGSSSRTPRLRSRPASRGRRRTCAPHRSRRARCRTGGQAAAVPARRQGGHHRRPT